MTTATTSPMKILVTGATGKVGSTFIRTLLADPTANDVQIIALCHQREPKAHPRITVVKGSISDRAVVQRAMAGATHVLHLATCKEIPEDVMDVTVKGLFWLLEEARASATLQRFVLIGGDASVGHFIYPHPVPVTETQRHTAYEGCYALSKVLEEVMLEQYLIQYHLNACCLRAPWIMEKDDFKFSNSFGEDVFGGTRWIDVVGKEKAAGYQRTGTIPVMLDAQGKPVQRNFVHVDDLVAAIRVALVHPAARGQTFNICMDEPVDYRKVADHLRATRSLPAVDVPTTYCSTWLDNTKAKFLLGWRPVYDLKKLVDAAYDYQRGADDPRRIWYPG